MLFFVLLLNTLKNIYICLLLDLDYMEFPPQTGPCVWAVAIETKTHYNKHVKINLLFMLQPELLSKPCCYTKIIHIFWQIRFKNSAVLWCKEISSSWVINQHDLFPGRNWGHLNRNICQSDLEVIRIFLCLHFIIVTTAFLAAPWIWHNAVFLMVVFRWVLPHRSHWHFNKKIFWHDQNFVISCL